MVNDVLMQICRPEHMHDLCLDMIYFIGGAANGSINKTLLPLILQWIPSGLATAQLYHYGQLMISGGFRQYDHGLQKNLKIYNSTTPPEYNMSNVRVPVAYFYSTHDPFSNTKMARTVFEKIPNVVLKYQVPIERWNHIDYILASNAHETQLIQKHGYPVETHTYETKDGYVLTAFRIPHGTTSIKSKEVALLTHGMGGSGENFVFIGPPDALAFYLADRGYDVWIFNARGTHYSRKHRSLNPNRDRKKYWNFSWHEIGVYDLPATINYIQKETGVDSIFYVGHSQGTTILFVMLSQLPEMNEKIRVGAMLAPSAFHWLTHSPLLVIGSKLWTLGERLLALLNWYELPAPNSSALTGFVKAICKPGALEEVCLDVVNLIGGTDSNQLNKTVFPVVLQYIPQGFSARQAWHYAQIVVSKDFKLYDHGAKKNMKLYNSTIPPTYNMSNCKAPIALFYAPRDPYGNHKMVQEFSKRLPNIVLKYEVKVPDWNHLDFILAANIKEVIHDPLYELFKRYEAQ
ncbi:lipase 3-like isoform X1 [Euwallacea similis]|uniref:lipase 3-like isoform X1 n=1 Tax=Euwallacea similis TaxID=1736056 RepID=UPI00344E8F71